MSATPEMASSTTPVPPQDSPGVKQSPANTGGQIAEGKNGESRDKSKRRFFGLGKRKESSDKTPTTSTEPSTVAGLPTISTTSAPSQPRQSSITTPTLDLTRSIPSSPPSGQHAQLSAAASPSRSSRVRSSSPRLHSPASSLIFERNVQESTIPDNMSATGIPSHIQVEDHIPPVLEASSLAITDNHLGPDEVEIMMHSAHQPAAEKVMPSTGMGISNATAGDLSGDESTAMSSVPGLSPIEDLPQTSLHQHFMEQLSLSSNHQLRQGSEPLNTTSSPALAAEASESYAHGSTEPADVRRLSFISFADVVQSEQRDADLQSLRGRDSVQLLRSQSPVPGPGLTSSDRSMVNRSPSPVPHSPANVSSQALSGATTSSPVSGTPNMKGLDISAAVAAQPRSSGTAISPISPGGLSVGLRTDQGTGGGGDILVQTMRETLRRTGSGDLNALYSRSDVASSLSKD